MFGNKPAFGSNTGFGAGTFGTTASPFGQGTTAFGAAKPIGSAFGTQSFGAAQPTTSIFGSGGGTSGIFGGGGTSTFGQPSAPSNAGFGFPSASTGSGLFGSAAQPTAGTGLFSNTSASAFGAPKPTFGGFGSSAPSTGLFGQTQQQQQQPTQQTSLMFNQSGTTGSALFGSSAFGTAATSGATGTTVKFQPVTGSDTMMKNGVTSTINTRHMCITVMKEYEAKSLEELRVEDYIANRKGPSQGTSLGGFGAGTPQSLFGSTAATAGTSGLFGQNQNKTFFGSTANTGFGGSTGTGLFGQSAPQNVSPFNKPIGFGAPATTQSSAFSFGNTSTFGTATPQNKSLFGQPTLPSTGIFGASTAAAPAFGTSSTFSTGFGTQNQNASPFSVKPVGFGTTTTTAAPGFSFGTNTASTTTPFLFNKPTGTAFGTSFGAPSTGFGGFGTTANAGSSLFGQNKTQIGFGTGFGSGLGTSSSSLFGPNTNKPAGLGSSLGFGTGTNTGFGLSTGLPLGGMNFNFGGTGSALGSDQSAAQLGQQQASLQQQLLALTASPYGDSPLFRNVLQDPAKKDEMLKPTNPQAQKALTSAIQYKVSPKAVVKLKPRPLLTLNSGKSSLFDGFEDYDSSSANDTFLPRKSVKKLVLKSRPSPNLSRSSNHLNDSNSANEDSHLHSILFDNERNLSPVSLVTPLNRRQTSERPVSTSPPTEQRSSANSTPVIHGQLNSESLPSSRFPRQVSLDDSIPALSSYRMARQLLSPEEDTQNQENSLNNTSLEEQPGQDCLKEEETPHPAGIVLRKVGYYTIPSLEELANMVDEDGNCFVENFTIGRESYGNVYFPGITNVAKLNLDEIVHFRRKEVTIYPNDDLKPTVGQGLNKKAQITLDCVWPSDKSTHAPIKSPERLKIINYQEKLEKVTSRLAAKFIEYRPETGSWVFQVNHFSKYGLEDSDDEEEIPASPHALQAAQPPKDLLLQQHLKHLSNGSAQMLTESLQINGERAPPVSSLSHLEAASVPLRLRDQDDEDDEMEGIMQQTFPSPTIEEDSPCSAIQPTSHRLAEVVGASTQRVQSMKATFFWDDSEDDENCEMVEGRLEKPAGDLYGHGPVAISNSSGVISKSHVSYSDDISAANSTLQEPAQHLRFQHTSSRDYLQRSKFARFSAPQSRIAASPSIQPPTDVLSKFVVLEGSGMQSEMAYKVAAPCKPHILVPFSKSVASEKCHLIADAACVMGRSFRVGWGPNFTITHSGIPLGQLKSKSGINNILKPFEILRTDLKMTRKELAPFAVTVENVTFLPSLAGSDEISKSHVEQLLQVQLSLTKLGNDGDCPVAVPLPGVELIEQQASLAAELIQNTSSSHQDYSFLQQNKTVWDLAVALWGNLLDEDEQGSNEGSKDVYAYHMARRQAFSNWLASACKQKISEAIQENKKDVNGQLATVFDHLTGFQIAEAVCVAQEKKDFRLSMLLSQAADNMEIRDACKRQLDHWEESKADQFIQAERLKIYALLAGTLVWPSSELRINACENLDWKRALALHLWYQCPPVATIADVLVAYEESFKGDEPLECYAQPPKPVYFENKTLSLERDVNSKDEFSVYDICYHLLKLYCDRSHRLDHLLTPTTYTHDPLDHRLSWLLSQALKSVGYQHFSESQDANLHVNFASQLASMGLWEWSAFALLHISDPVRRKSSIVELLRRHVSLSSDYVDKDRFLWEKLLVPQEWINEAKAVRARRDNDFHAEAFYLLKSKQWNQSHKLIIRHIAPEMIINENYDYLKGILDQMSLPEHSSVILDWTSGGQVYLDYIHLSQTVDKILKGEVSAYELEGLQPEVTSLCNRLSNLHCNTAKDRLCVSEMAKKTANLLRVVLSLGSGMTTVPSRLLAPHFNKLPLPEDCGVQELRALTQSYFLEMT